MGFPSPEPYESPIDTINQSWIVTGWSTESSPRSSATTFRVTRYVRSSLKFSLTVQLATAVRNSPSTDH